MSGIGNFLKGAGGGAMAGGATGNPWAALGGGVLGGVAGLFGGDDSEDQKKRWQDFYDSMSGKNAPQATLSGESSFRGDQQSLVSQLQAMASGQGPSLAGQMFKTATDRNIAQQQAMSQSGVGNATMASQGAANNSARLGAQSAQDAASARIMEQMNAVQSLGGVLQGARGQDLNNSQFNADAQNSMAARLVAGRLAAINGLQGNVQPSTADQLLAGGSSLMSMRGGMGGKGVGGGGK